MPLSFPSFWRVGGYPTLSIYFLGLRFCTSVNSKVSSPTMNEICRSLFVIARLETLKLLPFSMKSASSAINPPLVAFGLRSRLLNLYTVGALRVPAWANFWAAFSLSGGKSYSVFSPASTALSYARMSCASASSGNTALIRSRRSASVIRCAIITLPFLIGGWGFYAPPYEGLRRGGTGSCP